MRRGNAAVGFGQLRLAAPADQPTKTRPPALPLEASFHLIESVYCELSTDCCLFKLMHLMIAFQLLALNELCKNGPREW